MGIFVQIRGNIAFVNPTACEILGASDPKQLVGMSVLERVHPDFQERARERIQRLNDRFEKVETSEQAFLRLDGETIYANTSAIPFFHEGERGALVFLKDVTQRKLDRQQREASEELVRRAGAIAKVGGWSFDPLTGEGSWTEEVARIHDLDPDLPTNVALGLKFYLPSSRVKIDEAIARCLEHAESYDLELELVSAKGNHKWVRTKGFPEVVHGRVVRIDGIFQDITEARLAATALFQERERLLVTLRSIGDAVIATDTEGNVTLLNPVAEALTGWTQEEAFGRPLCDVFVILNELTRKTCEDPVSKVLKTGRVVELANHTCLIARDGRERSIADSGAPIIDDQGVVLGVVLVFRDVTEKHALADSMHRAQSLEAIGVLAGGIAHDFNNLLSGIFGNLSLAQDSTRRGDSEESLRALARALGIFERAKALTQQLLTFAKGGTPIRRVQQIGSLLRKSANFALSGANVSASLSIDPDLWSCDCDQNQIGQVIDNLVINAQQSMPLGGVVTLTACNVLREAGPSIPEARVGRFVSIRIADHGVGIPRELLSRIFDPFFSTKTTGHGLGLATVFSIVQRHDGWIEVDSTPGEGTTFDLFLPADPELSSIGIDSESAPSPWTEGTGRVLVMDDEEYVAEFLEIVLQSLGFSVQVVHHGQHAIEAFRHADSSGVPFRLCILDLTIRGGMGGIEAARAIRELREDVVLVASSGYSDDPVMADPRGHGFQGSLPKPFLRRDLQQLLEGLQLL